MNFYKLISKIFFVAILFLTAWVHHLNYRLKIESSHPKPVQVWSPPTFDQEPVEVSEPQVELNESATCDLIPQPVPQETTLIHKMESLFKGKLSGKSKDVLEVGKEFKVDPKLLAAIACHESGYGTSQKAKEYNNVTGTLRYDKNSKKWKARQFSSIRECFAFTAKNLRENYIKSGRTSIRSIGAKYCPVGAENDPTNLNVHWVTGVTKIYNELSI